MSNNALATTAAIGSLALVNTGSSVATGGLVVSTTYAGATTTIVLAPVIAAAAVPVAIVAGIAGLCWLSSKSKR